MFLPIVQEECTSTAAGTCNPQSGKCTCNSGYTGDACEGNKADAISLFFFSDKTKCSNFHNNCNCLSYEDLATYLHVQDNYSTSFIGNPTFKFVYYLLFIRFPLCSWG